MPGDRSEDTLRVDSQTEVLPVDRSDEELQEISEAVVRHARLEDNQQAQDFWSMLQTSGADKERNLKILATLQKGFNEYQQNLVNHAVSVGLKDFGNTNGQTHYLYQFRENPSSLTREKVEKLRAAGDINNTQALLLHQVCTLNFLNQTFLDIKEKSLTDQATLLGGLELANEITNFAKYAVQISQVDEHSFNFFRDLNALAYSSCTSVWFREVSKNKLDKTFKQWITSITQAITPKASGESHAVQLTYGALESIRDSFLRAGNNALLNHTNQIDKIADAIALKVLPSFFGVNNDVADENKLRIQIFKLLEYEDELGVKVGMTLIRPHLQACYYDNPVKLRQADMRLGLFFEQARAIHNARKIRALDSSTTLPEETFDLKHELRKRNKLINLRRQIENLRDQELYQNQVLSKEQQDALKQFLAMPKLSEDLKKKMITMLTEGAVGRDARLTCESFISDFDLPLALKGLVKLSLEKLSQNDNHKIVYYNSLLKRVNEKLLAKDSETGVAVGPDKRIIEHIDNQNMAAMRYLSLSISMSSMIIGDDFFSVYGGLLNPTEAAVAGKLSYKLSERLDKIDKLSKAITHFEKVHADGAGLQASTDGNTKFIRDAYLRLKDTTDKLIENQDKLKKETLKYTVCQVEEILEKQLKQKDDVNAELESKNAGILSFINHNEIFFKKMTKECRQELAKAEREKIAIVKQKIDVLKEKVGANTDSLEIQTEIEELIAAMAGSTNHGYDFSVLPQHLARINSLYKNGTYQPNAKDTRHIPFENPQTWLLKNGKRLLKYLNVVRVAIIVFTNIKRFAINTVTILPALLSRKTHNNKLLADKIKLLIRQINVYKSSLLDFDKSNIEKSDVLLKKANDLLDSVGRFTSDYRSISEVYLPQLQCDFLTTKNNTRILSSDSDTEVERSDAVSSTASPTSSVPSDASNPFSFEQAAELDSVINPLLVSRISTSQIQNKISDACYKDYVQYLTRLAHLLKVDFIASKLKLCPEILELQKGLKKLQHQVSTMESADDIPALLEEILLVENTIEQKYTEAKLSRECKVDVAYVEAKKWDDKLQKLLQSNLAYLETSTECKENWDQLYQIEATLRNLEKSYDRQVTPKTWTQYFADRAIGAAKSCIHTKAFQRTTVAAVRGFRQTGASGALAEASKEVCSSALGATIDGISHGVTSAANMAFSGLLWQVDPGSAAKCRDTLFQPTSSTFTQDLGRTQSSVVNDDSEIHSPVVYDDDQDIAYSPSGIANPDGTAVRASTP